MIFKKLPSQKYLKECFSYNEDSGEVFWLKRPRYHFNSDVDMKKSNTKMKGKLAGTKRRIAGQKGYIIVSISGEKYYLHRLIMKMLFGDKISQHSEVDHINGDGTDNRLENLRIVDRIENSKNKKIPSNNSSGHIGVHLCGLTGVWVSQIKVGNSRIKLGKFKNIDDAIKARKAAEIKHNFHENHGSDRPL